jgi:alkanesulfonate monooxygenase SsuD/methylene tetrahydromethanopterin reductase-like flavin-dependent oxidoreductase (luciferase family)
LREIECRNGEKVSMTIEIGLFDIHQVDPTDPDPTAAVFERRLELLALADRVGLRYAFTAERHFMPNYRASSATAWIAAASQRTSTIRLGVLAYTLPIHLPAELAEEVAVLDQLSNGRVEIGLGLGHRAEELIALGIDPEQRQQLFQERLAVMTALWEGGVVTLERPGTLVRGVGIHPLPMQQPYPPLWFAGSDPQAAYWAGMRGMSLALGFKRSMDLAETVAAFRSGCRQRQVEAPGAGRIALMRQLSIAPTDLEALDAMTEDLDRLDRMGSGGPGDLDKARGAAERMILDESFIAGSPETVARELRTLRERLDIDVFLANIHAAGVSDARLAQMTTLLAEEVAPLVVDAPRFVRPQAG